MPVACMPENAVGARGGMEGLNRDFLGVARNKMGAAKMATPINFALLASLSRDALFGSEILLSQLVNKLGRCLNFVDSTNALTATPNIFPSLGFGAST